MLERELESRTISTSISSMHESFKRKLFEQQNTADRNEQSVSPLESADKVSRDLMVEVWWNSPDAVACTRTGSKQAGQVNVSKFDTREAGG